ncbi:hypothetical protein J1605_000333 [Eschrichtius robustus]|uniref:SCAN domain-containing protein 3 n=1 Tax=Eschrichtius robustus TaxID=9764 RepID=A0AB34HMB1_ESCRO|nr:hypothetical protein J1605_000333 [Eschrichtius robustus]
MDPRDPFVNKPGELTLSVLEEDQLLEIANDGGLKSLFETTSKLHTFWIKVKAEYPEIATKALKSLLPFPTSYLCEAGFSAVTATKTRSRSRLDFCTHEFNQPWIEFDPELVESNTRLVESVDVEAA